MAKVKENKNLTYRGFSDLPIYNFYQIIQESDIRYFYKDFIQGDDFKVNESQEIVLLDRFKKVFDDRLDYTQDTKSKEYYRKLTEISNLETKLYRMQNSFNVMNEIPTKNKYFQMFVDDFSEEGYRFKKVVENDIDRIEYMRFMSQRIKRFKNKLNIKRAQYKDILVKPEVTDAPKFDLMKEKVLLEEALSRVIDIYVCPTKEWTALCIRGEEKANLQKSEMERIKSKRAR